MTRVAAIFLVLNAPAIADMRMAITPAKLQLSLEPGASHVATVEVSNNGDDAIRMISYVADWTTSREGGMVFLPSGAVDRSAAAWVEADLSEFILPPHDSRIVRVSASLPDTARGSYWALLFFEGEGETREGRLGVAAKARMGTTIYLTASGTDERDDVLTGMEVERTAAADSLQLVTSLANRGNVHYYPDGWFQVLDESGQVLFEEKLPLRVLLPGRETVYRIPWRPESAGSRRLVVTVDPGLETLMQGIKRFVVPKPPARGPAAIPERLVAQATPLPADVDSPRASPPGERTAAVHETRPIPDAQAESTLPYGVHVESFTTRAEVAVAKRRYFALDCPITVRTVNLEGKGTWHQIILGQFADKAEAQEFSKGLDEILDLEYMAVVRFDP